MSPELAVILMFVGVLVGVMSGFPIAFVFGSLGLIFGIITWGPQQIFYLFPIRAYGILSEYIFACVPLFIFMGCMIEKAGIAERAYEIMHKWFGPVRGGLAIATVLICTLFAATTGIIGASVVTMGLLALPAMVNRNYHKPLAAGCVCAGGTLGIIIPPSIMLVIYAPMAGISVAKMLFGAVIPGLVLASLYIIYILIVCALKPEWGPALPKEQRPKKQLLPMLREGALGLFPFIFLILAVLGTIFFGLAAPTEAASMGAAGSVLLTALYRKLTLKNLQEAVFSTLRISTMVIFVALGANLFTGTFLGLGGGDVVANFTEGLGFGPWGVFITVLFTIFILGMLMDWIGILFIMVPIFGPLLAKLGFDPLWAGIAICVLLQTSFLTPPFAFSIFYLKGIAPPGVTLSDITKGVIPFVCLQIVGLALVLAFKPLVLWLPGLIFK
ncbi:MAG: TRAP transporter large permease subunit [Thermodesulfobacteriota bacterium]|nr:TRAP transporter large permease subunit [Thermodesulfobacteriota bacterium]